MLPVARPRALPGLVVLAAMVVSLALLVVVVVTTVTGHDAAASAPGLGPASTTVGVSGSTENEIANRPFPTTPAIAADQAEPIVLPAATVTSGPVPMGFPRTDAGALAQLAATLTAFVEGFDPTTARTVSEAVLLPGGNGSSGFQDEITKITATRIAGGFAATGPAPGLVAHFTAQMGMVRASSGDFVQACVLGTTAGGNALKGSTESGPAVACSRMWWIDGQWRIEDAHSVDPPKVEPLSAAALASGWQVLR